MNKFYYCVITLLLPNYDNDIIAGMVKRKYSVEPGVDNGSITVVRNACSLCLFKLSCPFKTKKIDATSISDDLLEVLKENKVKYHSYFISEVGDAAYNIGNIILPSDNLPSKSIQ